MRTIAFDDESRGTLSAAVDQRDWDAITAQLDQDGHAMLTGLLDADACAQLARLYDRDELFRSRVVMAQHAYGRGEYKYFCYPLPPLVGGLRAAFYRHLARIANRWHEVLGIDTRFAGKLDDFLEVCHSAGQMRPTPLLLRYGEGDFNCLHQDLYGEHVFPLQLAILLSRPEEDFTGGELIVTQTRVRQQTQAEVIPLRQGDAVIFAVNYRPEPSARGGMRRVTLRHGVSRIRSGQRHTLGVIFHDAR